MQAKKTSSGGSCSGTPGPEDLAVVVTSSWMILKGDEVIYSGTCEGLKTELAKLGRAISTDTIKESTDEKRQKG